LRQKKTFPFLAGREKKENKKMKKTAVERQDPPNSFFFYFFLFTFLPFLFLGIEPTTFPY